MTIDWVKTQSKLDEFWTALQPLPKLISQWQSSQRFPELSYLREELLGSYKARKYQSLLPWIQAQGFKTVRLQGSSHSSNILQLSLLLRQRGIAVSYELEGREGPPVGNGLLSRLVLGQDFLSEPSNRNYDWSVPEGANCPQSLAGSLGLVASLVHQALLRKHLPADIYIDSGTGSTATALILGLGYFQLPCKVHVVSMTRQSQADIDNLISDSRAEFQRLLGDVPVLPEFEVSSPPVGQSFGSTPNQVWQEVQNFAQIESILTDPLYTAKLSLAYQVCRDPQRDALMFISGGQSDLLGFQRALRKCLSFE